MNSGHRCEMHHKVKHLFISLNPGQKQSNDGIDRFPRHRVLATSFLTPDITSRAQMRMLFPSGGSPRQVRLKRMPWVDSEKQTAKSRDLTCRVRGPELSSHPYKLSEGIRLHLLHRLPPMCLYCDLANAELVANLFIQYTADEQRMSCRSRGVSDA
jgi:hypothetical protein